ncbi:MAG: zf-HC2 domain-containing protein [Gemmatimonadaceae bacterium]
MTNSGITCDAFDAALPDYLEGTLDESTRVSVDGHLRECVRCTGLVRDLDGITKEAAALPDLSPSRDLWAGIESRIAAPVISLGATPARQRRFAPAWLGIAAAALIVSTAGITYNLTARTFRDSATPPTASAPARVQPSVVIPGEGTTVPAPTGSTEIANPSSSGISRLAQNGQTSTSRPAVRASLASRTQTEGIPSDAIYGKEIEMLQNLVRQRKSQLDPSTVAIIEKNLQIIDIAIEQSRAALVRDPASRMLSQQLTHALDKKVELLRTAAMLPAST